MEAADGIEALKVFAGQSVDCILTDFDMPNMNGCEFLEVLSREAMSLPPAVMITGNLSDKLQKRATCAGALAIIFKPVGVQNLLAILQAVVGTRRDHL
ncbi:MAG: response regulator [Nitrospira sp.]|nr:response regulator [Nitrospira sp.]HBP89384.1 hypothetical protein [Nitrospiraceae bacterium]